MIISLLSIIFIIEFQNHVIFAPVPVFRTVVCACSYPFFELQRKCRVRLVASEDYWSLDWVYWTASHWQNWKCVKINAKSNICVAFDWRKQICWNNGIVIFSSKQEKLISFRNGRVLFLLFFFDWKRNLSVLLVECSDKWLLKFHSDECKVLTIGKRNYDTDFFLNDKSASKIP